MVSYWTTKCAKQKNVRPVEKPERVLLTFMKSYQDLIFVYHGTGWEPKGEPKGQKRQAYDRQKTLASFY